MLERMLPRLSVPILEDAQNGDGNGNAEDDDEKKEVDGGDQNKPVSELTILTHQALVRELALMLDHMLRFVQYIHSLYMFAYKQSAN